MRLIVKTEFTIRDLEFIFDCRCREKKLYETTLNKFTPTAL